MLRLRTTPPPKHAKLTLILGLAMIGFAVVVLVDSARRWPPKEDDMAAAAMFAFWGSVIAETSRRSLRHGTSYLRIEEGRGTLTVVEKRLDRESIPLVDLGELVTRDHALYATALPARVLFESPLLLDVERRRVELERIVGRAQIRQLLSLDAPDDGAYRDDPTLVFRAQQLIPDRVRLQEVLDALGDGDPRVVALRAAIDSSRDRDRSA